LTIPNNGADVLILSGDIVIADDISRNSAYSEFFDHLYAEYCHVIFIMGNHEHYHGNINSSYQKIKNFLSKYPNVVLLENDTHTIDDVTFIGSTLWSSMNDYDWHTVYHAKSMMNDFKIVRIGSDYKLFQPVDWVALHHKSMDYIRHVYDNLKETTDKIVVVTHHAPSYKSIAPRFESDTLGNGCYFTHLDEFIYDRPKIKLWTHGHMHDNFDYNIGETRIVCNPRGYVDKYTSGNPDFNPNLIIEI
jgi:predicted phosphohydrolase